MMEVLAGSVDDTVCCLLLGKSKTMVGHNRAECVILRSSMHPCMACSSELEFLDQLLGVSGKSAVRPIRTESVQQVM